MIRLSNGVMFTWAAADVEAQSAGRAAIEPEHLLLGLCKLCDLSHDVARKAIPAAAREEIAAVEDEVRELRDVFRLVGLDSRSFRRRLRDSLASDAQSSRESEPLHRSPTSRAVFRRAEQLCSGKKKQVRPIQLLAALFEMDDPPWAALLISMGVEPESLQRAARHAAGLDGDAAKYDAPAHATGLRPGQKKDPAAGKMAGGSVLNRFGRDLTQLAAAGMLSPVIGRRGEMRTLARVLLQKHKNSAVLIGEAGVGKTCIVEGLAQRIRGPKPPSGLEGKRVVEVSMSFLVAGTKYRGEFEQRMQRLVEEAGSDPDLILFIDEFHTLMGAGGEGSGDAANILKPALARGEFRCIGATTIAEYRRFIEKDAALERRFQVVHVDEPTREETLDILKGIKSHLEEHHGLFIDDEALSAAVELSVRHLTDFRLPDKAIDLIDQACARARIATLSIGTETVAAEATSTIGQQEILQVVADRCRIPIERLSQDEAERFLRMEAEIKHRVIGQNEAVRAVCDAVRTARAGLKNPNRPVGVFLFAGSTGTGKTELAKALAEFLFADDRRLIRFDMSEFMEEHSVAKFIGSPPGYVGHENDGQLTGAVRSNPYSVLLFDEIEKAHPRVLDLFLQVFDEGQLTDSKGRKASFRDAVIILTTNLGSEGAAQQNERGPFGFVAGGKSAQDRAADADNRAYERTITKAVNAALRPELINRIDRLVCFYPLSRDAVRSIIDKILDALRQRLGSRAIQLNLSDEVYDLLLSAGYDPDFGAREMERTIERLIVQPLGRAFMEGKFVEGDAVGVVARNNRIEFVKA